ncbi:type II secretion system protein GspG [Mucilaginibacter antarcticus]|uniref:type II secretion system protein GspG n=1 Tax=Mucilaginibacter antarcticus TaxID=1855725 RepID=UPI0036289C92
MYVFLGYADKINFFGGAFINSNKNSLNSLVKEIEFYKIQNGKYPDNLQQLNLSNQFVNLHDPLLADSKKDTFNYQLKSKGYTIFSSGIDKIPNTKDDIYPTLSIDTAKMGLIIKR